MRLKHREHTLPPGRFRRLERGSNFRGMVRVVVDQQKTLARIFDLKTATRVVELAQRSGNFFKGNSQFGREGNYADGIMDVVPPGDIQDRFAQLLITMINTKDGCEIAQLYAGAAIIRAVGKAIGNRLR